MAGEVGRKNLPFEIKVFCFCSEKIFCTKKSLAESR